MSQEKSKLSTAKEKDAVLGNLVAAIEMIKSAPEFVAIIPEVRSNICYALPDAKSPADVAAIDGRINILNGLPCIAGLPRWGASDHLSRLLLELRKHDASINALIGFKSNAAINEILKQYAAARELRFFGLDRTRQPFGLMERDANAMSKKVDNLVASAGGVPRVFYQSEAMGIEAIASIVGSDAVEVTAMAIEIAKLYQAKLKGK